MNTHCTPTPRRRSGRFAMTMRRGLVSERLRNTRREGRLLDKIAIMIEAKDRIRAAQDELAAMLRHFAAVKP